MRNSAGAIQTYRERTKHLPAFFRAPGAALPGSHNGPPGQRGRTGKKISSSNQEPSLEGQAALVLGGQPFSLHFLHQRSPVHLKQLGGFARNPVGSSKCTDDEAVLKLFEFP